MIRSKYFCAVFVFLVAALRAQSTPLRVVILDQTGAGFPDVLVVVKSLESGGESFRALTDRNGNIPMRDLGSGLYQLIATCPYGICQTAVTEFVVKSDPIDLRLPVKVMPTVGSTVTIGPVEHRRVEVQDRNGRPIASAPILVRDATAQNEKWYKTEPDGGVVIDLPSESQATVIAVYRGNLISRTL